jgi:hypothetical protein
VFSKLTCAPNRLHEQAFSAGIAYSAQQRNSNGIIVEVTFLLSINVGPGSSKTLIVRGCKD